MKSKLIRITTRWPMPLNAFDAEHTEELFIEACNSLAREHNAVRGGFAKNMEAGEWVVWATFDDPQDAKNYTNYLDNNLGGIGSPGSSEFLDNELKALPMKCQMKILAPNGQQFICGASATEHPFDGDGKVIMCDSHYEIALEMLRNGELKKPN